MRVFLLLCLVACGHYVRTGGGPLVDGDGNPGVVASVEVGKHLIGGKEVAMPIGVRLEASATLEGAQGLIGFAYGGTLPPGGRNDKGKGWGGRLDVATGLAIGESVGLGTRFGLALTKGSIEPGKIDGGGCSGGHEKMSWCYSWRRWSYQHTGVELGATLFWVGDDMDEQLHLDGWRISAEFVRERGVLRDLSF